MKKILMALLVLSSFVLSGCSSTYWYSQISSKQVEKIKPDEGVFRPNGGMSYEYTLTAYDGQGMEKEISFGTDRLLKDDAFIRLEVVPLRGVVGWEEVDREDLPKSVKERY